MKKSIFFENFFSKTQKIFEVLVFEKKRNLQDGFPSFEDVQEYNLFFFFFFHSRKYFHKVLFFFLDLVSKFFFAKKFQRENFSIQKVPKFLEERFFFCFFEYFQKESEKFFYSLPKVFYEKFYRHFFFQCKTFCVFSKKKHQEWVLLFRKTTWFFL
jgi:hypothetical protein